MTIAGFRAWRLKLIAWLDRERTLPPVVVLRETRQALELRESVPATTADCPTGPCPHVRCRFHLWRDDAPSGRPGLSRVPRDADGRTLSVPGQFASTSPPRLLPRWLETPTPESCALRVARLGPRSNEQIADVVDRHRTLVAREVKRAARKACDAAEEQGVSEGDFAVALMGMGECK